MQAKTAGFPIVVVIGQQSPVFSGLRQWLKDALPRGPAGNFRTIAEALESSLLAAQPPDLTIVLREYSDQYAPQDVSRLIGRVLFSRLLCCSTAWCVSDGRTHDVWPIACRTELQTAECVSCTSCRGSCSNNRQSRRLLQPRKSLRYTPPLQNTRHWQYAKGRAGQCVRL